MLYCTVQENNHQFNPWVYWPFCFNYVSWITDGNFLDVSKLSFFHVICFPSDFPLMNLMSCSDAFSRIKPLLFMPTFAERFLGSEDFVFLIVFSPPNLSKVINSIYFDVNDIIRVRYSSHISLKKSYKFKTVRQHM